MKSQTSYTHKIAGALALALVVASGIQAQSTAAFWSFQTTQNGTGGTFTSIVTASTFQTIPTLSYTGSNITSGGNNGGAASFQAFDGTTWSGSGTGSTPGHSLAWNSGSTGNSFSVTLDTTGLSSLQVRMDLRSYTGGLMSFSNLQYDTGSGWGSSGLSLASFSTGTGYSVWSLDLSSLVAINNQSSVTLRWSFADIPSGSSLRVDNLQITAIAVPEPASIGLAFGVVTIGAIALYRRRIRKQM
ncbi:hypothetical protein Ga0100231_021575 [Opitutaceae bacterium TAV4]|nr:hypothetical protein Ga0100231_021575 [Opitutaceae bacterium TAV4]RRJ99791.1 hypothetical protein Ga0100230_017195 [Opitutaceae bacterium TAV3]